MILLMGCTDDKSTDTSDGPTVEDVGSDADAGSGSTPVEAEPVGRGDRLLSAREALREAEARAHAMDAERARLSGEVPVTPLSFALDDDGPAIAM